MIHGDILVRSAVHNQKLSLCFGVVLTFRCAQSAVESGKAFQIRPRPGKLKHSGSPKTVSHDHGITDIASLKYRHESDLLGESENPEETYTQVILPDKIALAKEYIRRSSVAYDLQLIFKTVLRMAG